MGSSPSVMWPLLAAAAAPVPPSAPASPPPSLQLGSSAPRLGNASSVVACTFLETIVEDHFAAGRHFRYGACALDANNTYAFGHNVIHLVNLHGASYHRGQWLVLRLRRAMAEELHSQHRARRLRDPGILPHAPMWQASGKGHVVEQVLEVRSRPREKARRQPGRALSSSSGRTLLSICMEYVASSHSCTWIDEPYHVGVPQTHTTASYGRLYPAWDRDNSRFYVVKMDSTANPFNGAAGISTATCDVFMEHEPWSALEIAKGLYADANLAYSHTEFIVPPNLDDCKWAGIATLGTYNPSGNVNTPIPDGPADPAWTGTTWCKGPGLAVRAHELGHNMAMMHSSSLDCGTPGFVEYGDPRCIMGSGSTTFNAPQRLTHGWISTAPQFATSNIYPSGGVAGLATPPGPTNEVCVFSTASFGAHLSDPSVPLTKFRVRKLAYDPTSSTIGDCTIIYLAKEGHEVDPGAATFNALLENGNTADLGAYSQIVVSYDDSSIVSVHTHAAWGVQGDYRRPVLLDSITATDYVRHEQHSNSVVVAP